MGLLDKFKYSLAKTRAVIVGKFVSPQWDAAEMERALIGSDFGPRLSAELVKGITKRLELNPRATTQDALMAARDEIESVFKDSNQGVPWNSKPATGPWVVLFVGVNGTGKTTTVAKFGAFLQNAGEKPLLAAADTFRAAAIDQLKSWGAKLKIEVVAGQDGADPGSVAFEAVKCAQAGGFSHLLIDTAGRQHTKSNLMQELQKIRRVVEKGLPGAPHEVWLVVDAPTGGNALIQAKEFHAALKLTGIIVTKLDGTAKGGMVVAIRRELGLPVRFLGLGEGVDDLQVFDAKMFAEALFEEESKKAELGK